MEDQESEFGDHVQQVHDDHRLTALAQEVALVEALQVTGLEGVTQRGEDDTAVRVAPVQEEVRVCGSTVDLEETQVRRALWKHLGAPIVVAERGASSRLLPSILPWGVLLLFAAAAVLMDEALFSDVPYRVLPQKALGPASALLSLGGGIDGVELLAGTRAAHL